MPQDRRERRVLVGAAVGVRAVALLVRAATGDRLLRDLARYRTKLVQDRAREVPRVQKLLETAGIKLDSVISDVMGKAARQMLDALIAGERDPNAMAEMALTPMRQATPRPGGPLR